MMSPLVSVDMKDIPDAQAYSIFGYNDARAKAIAAYATERLDPTHAELRDIFNK